MLYKWNQIVQINHTDSFTVYQENDFSTYVKGDILPTIALL